MNSVAGLGADAVLLVGDVFDNARVGDDVLQFFVDQVQRLHVPTVVLPGNHDLLDETSVYYRGPFQNKARQPSRVEPLRW